MFNAFKEDHSIGDGFWQNEGDNPTDQQGKAWREWIEDRFMPVNRRMLELVTNRTDLVVESELPNCFRLLQLHIVGYEVLVKRWEEGNYSRHLPTQLFPAEELHFYAKRNYQNLKKHQAELLNNSLS